MVTAMHGEDWESVAAANTKAVVAHAGVEGMKFANEANFDMTDEQLEFIVSQAHTIW